LAEGYSRDQLIRFYQYFVSGGTLIAGSVGFGALIVGALAASERLNTALFGLSLMVITGTNWIYHWRLCQGANRQEQGAEFGSAIRRFYLYFFVGAPLIFSIGSLVWLSYNGFKALLLSNQSLWQSRYPIAGIITSVILASYHLATLRKDRSRSLDL
jgi:hypothetical protein